MESICSHCGKIKDCTESGKWTLCDQHSELKQYAQKEKKVNTIKRTPIKNKPVRIKQISKKQAKKIKEYSPIALKYKIENPICNIQIEGVCTFNTTDVHHIRGKVGFADQWAIDNNIPLLIDVRFFNSTCRGCHSYVEDNVAEAIENGHSQHRTFNK